MYIAEVAKLTKISIRMIRYYEKLDLIHPIRLKNNGYRLYNTESIKTLETIKYLNELGIPLKKICQIIPCVNNDKQKSITLCPDIVKLLESYLASIDNKIIKLTENKRFLQDILKSGVN